MQANRTSWHSGGWVDYASGTALWYHAGKEPLPIRWILVRYPDQRHDTEAFLCTDTQMVPLDVLDCYTRRWSMETTYEEARPSPGHSTRLCLAEPLPVSPILASLCANDDETSAPFKFRLEHRRTISWLCPTQMAQFT